MQISRRRIEFGTTIILHTMSSVESYWPPQYLNERDRVWHRIMSAAILTVIGDPEWADGSQYRSVWNFYTSRSSCEQHSCLSVVRQMLASSLETGRLHLLETLPTVEAYRNYIVNWIRWTIVHVLYMPIWGTLGADERRELERLCPLPWRLEASTFAARDARPRYP